MKRDHQFSVSDTPLGIFSLGATLVVGRSTGIAQPKQGSGSHRLQWRKTHATNSTIGVNPIFEHGERKLMTGSMVVAAVVMVVIGGDGGGSGRG